LAPIRPGSERTAADDTTLGNRTFMSSQPCTRQRAMLPSRELAFVRCAQDPGVAVTGITIPRDVLLVEQRLRVRRADPSRQRVQPSERG
jgi:hypothetical protein